MGKEIERKFLVDREKLSGYGMAFSIGDRIMQGYISDDGDTAVRVRTKGKKAFLTIKKNTDKTVCRWEYEYEIPYEDAMEMLNIMCETVIEKNRAYISLNGYQTWEVDVFTGPNEGLVIAELELKSEDEEILFPEFVGKEVTDDPRYLNANLAKEPYCTWK